MPTNQGFFVGVSAIGLSGQAGPMWARSVHGIKSGLILAE